MSRLAWFDVWWLYGLVAITIGITTHDDKHTSAGLLALTIWTTALNGVPKR